jgi:hypothetical protein
MSKVPLYLLTVGNYHLRLIIRIKFPVARLFAQQILATGPTAEMRPDIQTRQPQT